MYSAKLYQLRQFARFMLCFIVFMFLKNSLVIAQGSTGPTIKILVQRSPLAGYQYHAGAAYWQQLRVGDELALVREPNNKYDRNAVRVLWRGKLLGYLPRVQNQPVAKEMDGGAHLLANIAQLSNVKNPWQRMEIDVYVVVGAAAEQ